MNVVDVDNLTYRYGRVTALRDVEFAVPQGALYALLGPNGSGKTTLLQVLMGLRRPAAGCAKVLGTASTALTVGLRGQIGYVAEGQSLPQRMRLAQVEAYLAPLYDTWDTSLARELREQFELDPTRKISSFSRGEQMKAALLCALAPRPKLLIMDEPFTGMDALVKDELVRGLLQSAGSEGWTVLLCSHDIGELELLADWVGFLDRGSMRVSEPIDRVRERFKHIDVTLSAASKPNIPEDWMCVERAGQRMTFLISNGDDGPIERVVSAALGGVTHVDSRDATLREIFVGLAKRRAAAPLAGAHS